MKKIIVIIILISNNLFCQRGELGNSINNSFIPESGKYVISGWVKENQAQQVLNYTSFIRVTITGVQNPVNVSFTPNGAIIDGWQRIVGVLEIPVFVATENPELTIALECNNASGNECYYDDIRFYPFNGNLKSFVYDEETQRLMAELDENNFATFYEYDLEGGLVRVKKETERGVYTIQETRSNSYKRNE
ncbi:MAG: hypothetical protein HC854_11375 [Flavobacterium sp.]|nr:hypothetical protein [Flavobacterium sp.]